MKCKIRLDCDVQTDGRVTVAKTRLLRHAGKNESKILMKYKRITKVNSFE